MRIDSAKQAKAIGICLFALASTSAALGATWTVGGTLKGINTGESVTLLNNGKTSLTLSKIGSFTIATGLATGAAYDVTVKTQPKGQLCTVANPSGTIAKVNVTDVNVTCADTFTVGGTITGLNAKDKMTLLDNGGDSLPIDLLSVSAKPVPFTFHTPIATGAAYDVTVGTPPTGQVCTVAKGAGKVGTANVTSVAITCKEGVTIGGTVSDLVKGQTLILLDNKGNPLSISGASLKTSISQPFTFSDALAQHSAYSVTVGTQPADETCTVTSKAKGTATADVTNVAVTCTLNPLKIGGTIDGLAKGEHLTLLDNGGNALIALGTGSPINFTFTDGINSGLKFDVTVGTQPPGQACSVTGGSGTVGTADVKSVVVTCATGYSIGGTFQGLTTGKTASLLDNGGNTLMVKGTATGKGAFTFTGQLANGASYDVTVGTQPAGETCAITDGKSKVAAANVTSVGMICSPTATYTIGGNVTGLSTGQSVTLLDNGGDSLPIAGTGGTQGFTFHTALTGGAKYTVTVGTQPASENCSVTGGSNTVGSANVTNVAVACTPDNYSVSVTISGLTGTVALANSSDSDTLTKSTNGTFAFAKQEAFGAPYSIGVTTQPTGQTCTVGTVSNPASGTVKGAVNIPVSCTSAPTYTIGGNVTGLSTGQSVTLLDNGGDSLPIAGTGSTQGFTFHTALVSGAKYAVTVGTQPANENCSVTGGSSTVGSANVTNVAVACTPDNYDVSVTVSGLTGTVVLANSSDTDSLSESANGTFKFPKQEAFGSPYHIGVTTQPSGQTCTVGSVATPASGTVSGALDVPVSCTTNPTYAISVTISGLTGSITVANTSDSDSLTETANGTYQFSKKEASGASYDISVTAQPTGLTCTPGATGTPASGTVSGAVTVLVSCTTSSGGGGGSGAFWIPYVAQPIVGAPTAGQNGLFIIPSDKLESNPTPTWVNQLPTSILGVGEQYNFTGDAVSSYSPKVMAYYDVAADGTTQIYGLTLAGTSSTPKPTAIGTAISSSFQICDKDSELQKLDDPTSGFVVLEIGPSGTNGCNTGPFTFAVQKYTDSASTPAATVSITSLPVGTLYNDGSLVGLLYFDSKKGNLDIYADNTFTSPKVLLSGVQFTDSASTVSLKDSTPYGVSVAYLNVSFAPTMANPEGSTSFYMVDDKSGGTATQVYAGEADQMVNDDNNIYFVDEQSSATKVTFYQAPIDSATTKLIYTGALSATDETSYELFGSNDSILVFGYYDTPVVSMVPNPNAATSKIFTIPVGTDSTAATLIGTYNGTATGTLVPPKANDVADEVLFVSIESENIQDNPPAQPTVTFSYSSLAGSPGATLTQKPLANSYYESFGLLAYEVANTVIQVQNISQTTGGYGGGNFFQVDVGTLTATEMTTIGGADYTIPTDDIGYLLNFFSDTTGIGFVAPFEAKPTAASPQIGLAGDFTKNFVLPITVANSNVAEF